MKTFNHRQGGHTLLLTSKSNCSMSNAVSQHRLKENGRTHLLQVRISQDLTAIMTENLNRRTAS